MHILIFVSCILVGSPAKAFTFPSFPSDVVKLTARSVSLCIIISLVLDSLIFNIVIIRIIIGNIL